LKAVFIGISVKLPKQLFKKISKDCPWFEIILENNSKFIAIIVN